MKPFVKCELKTRIFEPVEDPEEQVIIEGMGLSTYKNAVIRTESDGFTYVTWIKPIDGWRNELAGMVRAIALLLIFIFMCIIFVEFAGAMSEIMLTRWGFL